MGNKIMKYKIKKIDKRGEMEEFIKIISWIAFFVLILAAIYFLIKRFTA
jgi:hypothetical protein